MLVICKPEAMSLLRKLRDSQREYNNNLPAEAK